MLRLTLALKVLHPSVTSLRNPSRPTAVYNKDNFPKGQLSGSGNQGRPAAPNSFR
jgi:hypothetical protein